MALVGVSVHLKSGAVIGTDWTYTKTINFGVPITILAQSALNSHGETDDESTAYAYISKFTDASGTHNVEKAAVLVEKCSSITGNLYVDECGASAVWTIFYFT